MLKKTLLGALLLAPFIAHAGTYQLRVASPGVKAEEPATVPQLTFSAVELNFGAVNLGQSGQQSVVLTNTGTGPTPVWQPSTSLPFAAAGDCPAILSPGLSCTLDVTFSPVAKGAVTSTLTVESGIGAQLVQLSGFGTVADFVLSPSTSLSFSSIKIGQSIDSGLRSITNTGNLSLPVSVVVPEGFNLVGNTCVGVLDEGASCSFIVRFSPTEAKPYSGAVDVTAGGIARSFTVSGTGLSTDLTITPGTAIAFGNITTGQTANSAGLTLKNTGTAGLNGLLIELPTGFSAVSNTCGTALTPAQTCSLIVRFAPVLAQTYSGSLSVSAEGITRTVSLTGTGVAPPAASIWTARTSSFGSTNITGAAYGNGKFVAVGNAGKIASSIDGVTWTQQVSNTTSDLRSIVFANGTFVAVGSGGAVLTSTNGSTWTVRSTPVTDGFRAIGFGNGKFVIASSSKVLTSTSGDSWTVVSTPIGGVTNTGVAFGNGLFVLIDYQGKIATSPDGGTWTQRTAPAGNTFGVVFANGKFVVVGAAGKVITSADGVAWTVQTSGTTNQFEAVAYANGLFFAGGQSGLFKTSPDGVTWTSRNPSLGSIAIWALTYGNNTYVAAGSAGNLATSGN